MVGSGDLEICDIRLFCLSAHSNHSKIHAF